ncbi:hypothetical protein Tco_0574732, partial [Tanacetum coccineum]
MCFHSKRLCIHMKTLRSINEEFKIIFRGKVYWIRANETPGWVPDFVNETDDEEQNEDEFNNGGSKINDISRCDDDSDVEEVLETAFEETGDK